MDVGFHFYFGLGWGVGVVFFGILMGQIFKFVLTYFTFGLFLFLLFCGGTSLIHSHNFFHVLGEV